MRIELKENDLTLLYDKAEKKYNNCINDKENQFLEDEVNIPLETIELIKKDIKIVFSKSVTNSYLLQITFILQGDNKEIGKYTYLEDNMGTEIDDSLVFY